MKVVFMGTPAFAVPALNALISQHEVLAVCTQPDRPAGRGHKLQPSPIKEAALAHNLPILQPKTLRLSESKEIREELKSFGADIFIVAAYGLLLPKGILNMPPKGCINIHASLLPKYRGASPIHSAILNGDRETGITIMHMDIGLDTGDMILQKKIAISPDDNLQSLHDKMAQLGSEAILEALSQIENKTAQRIPQNEQEATHAPLIKKSDGIINWNNPSEKIINQTRALNPWPGCFTTHNDQPLKIWCKESSFAENTKSPGTVLSTTKNLIIKTADGCVSITEIQALGKKRMPCADFLRGYKIQIGDVFS
ncbi:MAG: methionyl-tRNA formyltransferase [Defluviitaleaceae bacterium]|nr:methionyl-tRNA formyltransferase [Defluviitaleaceae bacterium]